MKREVSPIKGRKMTIRSNIHENPMIILSITSLKILNTL